MAVVYTTAAIVKKRTNNVASGMTDNDIEECIYQAEGIIDAVMCDSFLTTFVVAKHYIIRECATDLATGLVIINDPGKSFLTLADAELTAQLLWNSAQRSLAILANKTTVTYLKSL